MSDSLVRIQNFISQNIKSVAELEALLLLFKSSNENWSTERLSREMRSNHSFAESLLERICALGFAKRLSNEYRFQIPSDQDREILTELDHLYSQKRLYVIDLIYQAPADKLRVFADAFKIRKP